jgi:SSS family solute:Na+ symporter
MENWVVPFAMTIAYTVITVILGIAAKGKLDMSELGNWGVSGNTMGALIIFFLIGAGQISAFTFMGAPGWALSRGVAAFYVVVYLALMNFTIYLVNPRICQLAIKHNILTQAEAFGTRYASMGVRGFTVIPGSIVLIAYAEVQVVGCGYVLNIMSGGRIPTWLGIVVILIAVFSYIFTSGLRAIGWTNVLQGILMFVISLLVGFTLCYMMTGSVYWDDVFKRLLTESPQHLTLPGALNNYGPVMWSTSIIVCIVSIWPSFWIMAAGSKNPETARFGTSMVPLYQLVMIPMIVVGFICVFAMGGFEGGADKAALSLALETLPWWMVGLLGAGTLAAAQSSCEPLFQTLAFTWTHDFFGPILKWNEKKQGKIQRWLLIPFMFGIVMPLAITNPAQLVNILLIGYGFAAQLFPLALGLWVWPRSTKQGAVIGLIVGVLVTALFTWGPLASFGDIHGGIWGLAVNIILHIVISLKTKPNDRRTIETFFSKEVVEKLYVAK